MIVLPETDNLHSSIGKHRNVTDGQTDGRTDRQTDGRTELVWLLQPSAFRAMRTRCENGLMRAYMSRCTQSRNASPANNRQRRTNFCDFYDFDPYTEQHTVPYEAINTAFTLY